MRVKPTGAPFTVAGCEVEGACTESPAYAATIEIVPCGKMGLSVATPLAFRVAVPRTFAPIVKVTTPVGSGPLLPVTDATRATFGSLPGIDTPSTVAVGIVATTWLIAREVLAALLAFPNRPQ